MYKKGMYMANIDLSLASLRSDDTEVVKSEDRRLLSHSQGCCPESIVDDGKSTSTLIRHFVPHVDHVGNSRVSSWWLRPVNGAN